MNDTISDILFTILFILVIYVAIQPLILLIQWAFMLLGHLLSNKIRYIIRNFMIVSAIAAVRL